MFFCYLLQPLVIRGIPPVIDVHNRFSIISDILLNRTRFEVKCCVDICVDWYALVVDDGVGCRYVGERGYDYLVSFGDTDAFHHGVYRAGAVVHCYRVFDT